MTDKNEQIPIEERWKHDIAPTIIKKDGTVIEPPTVSRETKEPPDA